MNKYPLAAFVALMAIVLAATLAGGLPKQPGFQTYEIPAQDAEKATIVRAVLATSVDVTSFRDLGMVMLLSDQPVILSAKNLPENIGGLPTVNARELVESSNSGFTPLPPSYYALERNGFNATFVVMSEDMIKARYLKADGTPNTPYPVYLEFVMFEIRGTVAHAELDCLDYGLGGSSAWGGCEFILGKQGNSWSILAVNIQFM